MTLGLTQCTPRLTLSLYEAQCLYGVHVLPSSQRAPYTVALASLGGNLITFNDKYTDINAFFSHRRGFFEYKHQSWFYPSAPPPRNKHLFCPKAPYPNRIRDWTTKASWTANRPPNELVVLRDFYWVNFWVNFWIDYSINIW